MGEPARRSTQRTQLLLIEDHTLMGEGLRALLEPEYRVVDIIADGSLAIAAIREHRPDLVLLDLTLPHRSGLEILADLADSASSVPVVVVTQHAEPGVADQAFRLGALGFVSKDCSRQQLREAIGEAMAGRRFFAPAARSAAAMDAMYPPGFTDLTPRRQEIVRLIGRGFTSEQIAATLSISHWTVHFHRKIVRRHLGIHSDWEMIRYASRIEQLESESSSV